jgi:hypothetical protein
VSHKEVMAGHVVSFSLCGWEPREVTQILLQLRSSTARDRS